FRLTLILAGEQLRQHARYHLPRHAEPVLEPAALLGLLVAAGGELVPVIVHLFLGVAHHLERNGFAELEDRPAVEGCEGLPFELECHGHHRAGLLPMDFLAGLSITAGGDDLRIAEDAGVELRGFFSLAVEPEARRNFGTDLHRLSRRKNGAAA